MEGAWSCYRGVHFNRRRMVILQKRHFIGGRMVIQRWFYGGKWSFYRGAHFNGGRVVM